MMSDGQFSTSAFRHVGEWYESGPYSDSLQHSRVFAMDDQQGDVCLIRARHGAGEVIHQPYDSYTVFTVTRGHPGSDIDLGGGRFRAEAKPGMLAVLPASTPGYFRNDSVHEAVAISVPGAIFRKVLLADEEYQNAGLGPLTDRLIDDPMAANLLVSLWQEAGHSPHLDRLLVEHSLHLIVARMFATVHPLRQESETDVGNARVQRAVDYIRQNLSSSLTLEEIARVAHCSPFHLARLFKRSLDTTVHNFVMAQRIDLARTLLHDPKTPIVDIARRCGFSSQSHLTAAFRRATGATPAVFRREVTR